MTIIFYFAANITIRKPFTWRNVCAYCQLQVPGNWYPALADTWLRLKK